MSQISKTAASMMQEWINKHGFNQDRAMLEYANALAKHYGEAIGELSCQMYERTAEAQGAIIHAAEPAAVPEFGEVAKVVYGSKKQSEKLIAPAVGRLVKQVGADTTLKNAIRDRAQFAWVPTGHETCAFCIALASRGWQNASSKTLKNGYAEHIHANCDCQYAVRFDGESTVEGYDPQVYEDMYYNAGPGNPKDKINALRRANYQRKKETGGKHYAPYDPKDSRDVAAAKEYRKISRVNDTKAIAEASGMSVEDIVTIKRHIFYKKHQLYDKYDILYPDYDIAVAWKRLSEGVPEDRDLILLKHELCEAQAEKEGNLTLAQAHEIAKEQYDWEKALIDAVGEEGEKDGIL